MLAGFRRLFIISLNLVIWGFLILYGLRYMGLQQEFASHNHPLMSTPPFIIADGGDSKNHPPFSAPAYREARKHPDLWLKVDVRLSKDEVWFVYGPKYLQELTSGQGYPEHYSLAELKELEFTQGGSQILSFDDFLAEFGEARLILELRGDKVYRLNDLIASIEKVKAEERVVIQTSYQTIMTHMRRKRPQWLFGLTAAAFSKVRLLSAFYLEPIVDFRADLAIGNFKNPSSLDFSPRMMREVRRRGGKIVVRTDDVEPFLRWRQTEPIDAVLTRRPASFVELFL